MRRRVIGMVFMLVLTVSGGVLFVVVGDGIEVTETTVYGGKSVGTVTGDCEDIAIRQISVSVDLSRTDYRDSVLFGGAEKVTVTASVDGERSSRTVTLDEVDSKAVALQPWRQMAAETLPPETHEVAVEVTNGGTTIYETTRTVSLPRAEPGHLC